MILCDRCDNDSEAESFSLVTKNWSAPDERDAFPAFYRVDLCVNCQMTFSADIRKWLRTKPLKEKEES